MLFSGRKGLFLSELPAKGKSPIEAKSNISLYIGKSDSGAKLFSEFINLCLALYCFISSYVIVDNSPCSTWILTSLGCLLLWTWPANPYHLISSSISPLSLLNLQPTLPDLCVCSALNTSCPVTVFACLNVHQFLLGLPADCVVRCSNYCVQLHNIISLGLSPHSTSQLLSHD